MLSVAGIALCASLLGFWACGRCWIDARDHKGVPEYLTYVTLMALVMGASGAFLMLSCCVLTALITRGTDPNLWVDRGGAIASAGLSLPLLGLGMSAALNAWAFRYRGQRLSGRGSLPLCYREADKRYGASWTLVGTIQRASGEFSELVVDLFREEGIRPVWTKRYLAVSEWLTGRIILFLFPGIWLAACVLPSSIRASASRRLNVLDGLPKDV